MVSNNVKKLFELLNKNDVLYCHWKSTDHLLASFQAKTDLDVLVSKHDSRKLESILNSLGFIRMHTPDIRTYPGVEDFVLFDHELERWIHFHLHYQLPCGDRWVKSYHLPIENYLLERRIWNDEFNIYIIDEVSEYLFMLLRMHMKWRLPYKKQSVIKENEFLRLRVISKGISFQTLKRHPFYQHLLEKTVHDYFEGRVNDRLIDIIRCNIKQNSLRRHSYFKHVFIRATRYLSRIRVEFSRRVFKDFSYGRRSIHNGGRLVVFLGMDGAGKTSMLSEAASMFSKQMNVTSVFLGTGESGAGFARRLILKIFKRKLSSNKLKKTGGEKNISLPKLLWIYLCIRDREREVFKLTRAMANGSLVLVDRWPQIDVKGFADYPKLSDVSSSSFLVDYLRRREGNLFNKIKKLDVDKCLYFNISPETSLIRKPHDLTLDLATSYVNALDTITSNNFPSTVVRMDADREYNIVRNKTFFEIWNTISYGL
ncbi:TPA: hypothetical protein L3N28_003282 [Vibrio parahaemolyticus]|uniref:hypothetical protein n=1 Tax=Vibrio alginolyticus TaxID=663 RepID=UPI0035537B6B|nr:hypothetical protein [Vibrio parahaemolyticus]HBN6312888.1 hypothetical protein [Vibrio parahaemolyticus]